MARVLSLVMAGLLLSSVGCTSWRWVGEHRPPWPHSVPRDAYEDVRPTVETPGLDGGLAAIAGGRINDHGVYIDILIETPENRDIEREVWILSRNTAFGEEPGRRWLALADATGQRVSVIPKERPHPEGNGIPLIDPAFGHLDRLTAAPGLSRYIVVVWYHTLAQLEPGTYTLFVPDIEDVNSNWARSGLGLEAFDNTPIELRYADGFVPDDGDG